MVLVDTPGIKEEDDDDNSQLFTHLRKASALIYIIKTDNAGGTHKVLDINQYINIRIPRNVSSSFLFMRVSIIEITINICQIGLNGHMITRNGKPNKIRLLE